MEATQATTARAVPSPAGRTENDARIYLLACIVDSSDDAIVSKTLDGTITSWNRAAELIYGYAADEIIGRSFSVLIAPDRPDELRQILGRIRAGERVEHFETVRVRKDGRSIAVSLTVSPIQDAQGNILGASSIARDITDRQRADERLKAASEYVRSLLEASLDPLVTISPAGKITDVNEATVKVTGVLRERLVGTDFSDYFTDPEKAREGYEQVFSRGFVTDYPLTIRHRSGALTDVLYNASVYQDRRGNVLGVFAAARDVTTQKRAAEVAAQRAKELERLAELERFQSLTVGRELRMVELKKENEELRKQLAAARGER